jgi:hypothetical protein
MFEDEQLERLVRIEKSGGHSMISADLRLVRPAWMLRPSRRRARLAMHPARRTFHRLRDRQEEFDGLVDRSFR